MLLGAIMQVALDPSTFGVLGGDDALARRTQYFGQAHIAEGGAVLRCQVVEQRSVRPR
jgi:hypothetical protein